MSPIKRRRCPLPGRLSHTTAKPLGIVRHGFLRSRHGSRLRLLCRDCGRTFCNRRGSAYYRLQHPRSTFDHFVQLLSEGMSCASLARVLRVCPATISRWLARAGRHALAFADEHDHVAEPVEIQFDEISARPATQSLSPWIFSGIEVSTRYWLAAHVGRRSIASTRAFVLRARQSLAKLPTGLPFVPATDL